jgi:bifunctional pyridoxal-dependent enzyme with beta-cystathionase and maltose regulon repressor activities
MYGDSDFLRVNMATQHSTFEVGVKRMVHGLKRLLAK